MKHGLIVFIEDKKELNAAYELLIKSGFDAEKGELEEVEPKTLYVPTGAELKAALLELQETNGKEALVSFLKSHGATSPKNLKKSEWAVAYAELNELNNLDDVENEEPESDDDEFDDLLGDDDEDDDLLGGDDDLDMEAPEPDEVKVAVQKYAQKNGREKATAILKKHGLNTVRGLAKASDEALIGIMQAVS